MYILTSKYFPTDSWPDLYFPALPEGADIQYKEVVEFTLAAAVTAEFDVVLPNGASVNVTGAGMAVSGAGSSGANGTYSLYGTRDGLPRYRKLTPESASGYAYIVYVLYSGNWYISQFGDDAHSDGQASFGCYYYSNDDVATPDLATTWGVFGVGVAPVPAVAPLVTPTLTEVAAFTLEMPQVITMEVYEELSL